MSTLASVVIRDLLANRPTAGIAGREFFASDTGVGYRDNGSSWDVITGQGTVTSISLTMPSDFAVGGSPVTTTGTLAVTANTQTANTVKAGPSSGAAAAPTYRSLVAADIPAIAESGVTSLVSDLAAKAATATTISTTAPLTGGGDLSANRTLAISAFTGDSGSGGAKGAVPAPASGDSAAGKFLAAGGGWSVPSGGAGTVTSVALTVPSFLSVAGSPITASGTLAVTAATGLTANQVLATPNGSTGAVSLRSVAAADLPNIPVGNLNSGTAASSSTFWRGDGTWAGPPASPTTTKGDLATYSTVSTRLAVGSDTQMVVADSTQTTGLKWAYPPLTIGFVMSVGSPGTNVGPQLIAPRAGIISKCKVVTKASDPSTDLTFTIKQNGTSVFTSNQTITHGTAGGTITTITALTSTPLNFVADDLVTIDVSSGSTAWNFVAILES